VTASSTEGTIAAVKDVAVVALLDERRHVLLVRQSYGRRWWALPGGEVEQGESAENAALREVKEETGLDLLIARPVGQYSLQRPSGRSVVYLYAAEHADGSMHLDPSEVEEAGWFAADDVPEETNDVLRQMVKDAAGGAREVRREFTVNF
jgi:ADP-ribose pyrophosphatase YjhB (NUDIX family)